MVQKIQQLFKRIPCLTLNDRFPRIRANADGAHAGRIQKADVFAHHGLSRDFNTGVLKDFEWSISGAVLVKDNNEINQK